MTPLDHLTSAFECLWEAKTHLLKVEAATTGASKTQARALHDEVAALRDRVEKALIELQAQPPAAPPPPAG